MMQAIQAKKVANEACQFAIIEIETLLTYYDLRSKKSSKKSFEKLFAEDKFYTYDFFLNQLGNFPLTFNGVEETAKYIYNSLYLPFQYLICG